MNLRLEPMTEFKEEKKLMNTLFRACKSHRRFVAMALSNTSVTRALVIPFMAGLMALAGCTGKGSSNGVQVGAIAFTDSSGNVQTAPTSITAGQGTYVEVTLSNDTAQLGANWTVNCGSKLASGTPLPPGQTQDYSCGSFVPAHTTSGPIPSYAASASGYIAYYAAPSAPPKEGVVTLYAVSESDSSKFSYVTLSVIGQPISVAISPTPASPLTVRGSESVTAVLDNDYSSKGVTWSATCAFSSCGSFSSATTTSGVSTTYTAPSTAPAGGGVVTITAVSVADPTKYATATITIEPVVVSISPATFNVATNNTATLTANVLYDIQSLGVDWSVTCANSTTPGTCGTITSHTASGVAATYTAPALAQIAVGTAITITATSSADSTKSATATATTVKGQFVSGGVFAAQQPVSGATVTLYAAKTSDSALSTDVTAKNATAITTATTDEDGSFTIPYGYECPASDTQMYLVARGGNAGGGANSALALITAVGDCSKLDASRFVIDEATTVAATYALSNLMTDAQHVGSASASPSAIAAAFSTAHDLVDVKTGAVRSSTVSGNGTVPQAKINTVANLLNSCAVTSGTTTGGGSTCDELFQATNPGTTEATRATDTLSALLQLVKHAVNQPNSATLDRLAGSSSAYQTALQAEPSDWMLSIAFSHGTGDAAVVQSLGTSSASSFTDSAGNIWIRGNGGVVTEFVGAQSCVKEPDILIPIAADLESIP